MCSRLNGSVVPGGRVGIGKGKVLLTAHRSGRLPISLLPVSPTDQAQSFYCSNATGRPDDIPCRPTGCTHPTHTALSSSCLPTLHPLPPPPTDKAQSFYCGDAAGRPTDFIDKSTSAPSTVDKNFAAAIGLPFKVPEEVFG